MTPDKIATAGQALMVIAASHLPEGARGVKMDTSVRLEDPYDPRVLPYLLWMGEQIPGQLEEGSFDKAERWICFIQGVLWLRGIATIDDFRDMNRDEAPA